MNDIDHKKLGKYVAKVLRHSPEDLNLKVDEGGWVDFIQLVKKLKEKGFNISKDDLKTLVANDKKGRFSIKGHEDRIRANQGHSIKIKMDFDEQEPPVYLYHGTGMDVIKYIIHEGIDKRLRDYVHLSPDKETAKEVGKRKGKPIVIPVQSQEMWNDRYKFYLSDNGVWLTDYVPPEYISPPDFVGAEINN